MRMIAASVVLLLGTLNVLFGQLIRTIEWEPKGPGGGGGMFCPAISPHDENLMFVSCDMGGVYRSSDKGTSWEMLNFRVLKSEIYCSPVFHPSDPNTVYYSKNGLLYKSTDRGDSWEIENMSGTMEDMVCLRYPDKELRIIVCSGAEGVTMFKGEFKSNCNLGNDVLYLAEDDPYVIAAGTGEIHFSTDRGDLFADIPLPEDLTEIIDIEITGDTIYILEAERLLASANRGADWYVMCEASEYDRGDFRILRVEENHVWITTEGGHNQCSALYSSNAGITFKPVFFCNSSWDDTSNLENGWLDLDFNCGWGGAALRFNISRTNPQTAVWTDAGRMLATFDAGETWQSLYTTPAEGFEREPGSYWKTTGLDVTSSWDIYQDEHNSDFINVAYTDIGGSYSSDGGENWRTAYDGGIPGEWRNTTYQFAYDDDNDLLWGAFSGRHDIPGGWSNNTWSREGKGGVAYSADGGMSWTALTENGLPDKPVTSIAIDFSSNPETRRLFAAVWSDGVWRSNDGGESWERCSEGLGCGDGTLSSDGPNTHVVEVRVNAEGTVYALKTKYIRDNSVIKNDGGLWKSADHGDSWEMISENVADCTPNPSIDLNGEHSWADPISFLLDEDDTDHIFVCAQNCNNGKVQGGLYETTDGGENWIRLLQIYGAHKLTKSKYNEGRYYLATMQEGLMFSDDNCQNWIEIENFPFSHTTKISEDLEDSDKIWVNTFGGGVWQGVWQEEGAVCESLPDGANIFKVYPNPASGLLNLTAPGCSNIEIYDMCGRLIGRYPGNTGVIDVSAWNNGAYLIKAVFNDYYLTEIISIVK